MSWPQLSTRPLFEQHILDASTSAEAVKAGAIGALAGAVGAASFGWWVAMPKHELLKDAAKGGAFFAAAGAAFYGTKVAVAQIRHKDDMWNGPAGGLVAGLLLGLRSGKMNRVVAHTFFLPIVIGLSEWASYAIPTKGLAYDAKAVQQDPNFFKWPRRDPFKERWEEIQKREQSNGSTSA